MKKKFIVIILILISINSFSQIKRDSANLNQQFKNSENIKQGYEIQKNEMRIKNLERDINSQIEKLQLTTNSQIEKLDTKVGYYLLFGSILLTVIGFVINFFGRRLIIEKIESTIEKTANEHAEEQTDKVIKEFIDSGKIDQIIQDKGEPAIREIITKIETQGITVIDAIKVKGEKAISSMIAKQEKVKPHQNPTSEKEIIEDSKEARAKEFFDLAYSSKDPLVQIELYKNVLEIQPNNVQALNNIGAAFNNAYTYNEAIKYLKKCIELRPNYALPYANLANSYNLSDDLDKAIEYANKAIAIDPNLDWSYSVKGNVLTKKGDLKAAEKTFNLAIELNPRSPEAYNTRGYFYEETGKFEEAEIDFIKSEKLGFPNKAMLYNNFAVLYRRKKEFNKAIEYLNKARKENPNFPNIDGTLALIYADKNDRENFYKYLVIALEKGCPAWHYLGDPGFDPFRDEEKLHKLLDSYKRKYVA